MDFRNRITSFVHGSSHKGNRKIQRFMEGGKIERETEESLNKKKDKRSQRFGTNLPQNTKTQKNSKKKSEEEKRQERRERFTGHGTSSRSKETNTRRIANTREPSDLELKHFHELSHEFYQNRDEGRRRQIISDAANQKKQERNYGVNQNTIFVGSPKQMKSVQQELDNHRHSSNKTLTIQMRGRKVELQTNNDLDIGPKRTHEITVKRNKLNEPFKHYDNKSSIQHPKKTQHYNNSSSDED